VASPGRDRLPPRIVAADADAKHNMLTGTVSKPWDTLLFEIIGVFLYLLAGAIGWEQLAHWDTEHSMDCWSLDHMDEFGYSIGMRIMGVKTLALEWE
jgi:hypothetical protein